MAVITPNTFDPTRRYVGVRLQQGVPIVDADWNELDDLVRFEMRALVHWFIGNGVPTGSDAFRIEGTGLANDFEIRPGLNGAPIADPAEGELRVSGQCLVEGRAVRITTDVRFTAQKLHESRGTAADAEAALLGVPKVKALAAAPTARTVAVYLDVWERLVTPAEDATLVLGSIGTESCARMKREWVVRVRDGAAAPAPGETDFAAGHGYLLLATIERRAGDAAVKDRDVTDARLRRLSLADLVGRAAKLERLDLPEFNSPKAFIPLQASAGQTVTLFGRNFDRGDVTVKFGALVCTLAESPTANQLQAKIPSTVAVNDLEFLTVETSAGTVTSSQKLKIV